MISPAQAKRDRAELLRQLHRDQRRKLLARLAELRAEEARARVERREQLALARQRCVTRAEQATLDAAAAYKLAVQLAKDARAATKAVARDQCILEREHARAEGAHKIAHAKRERETERAFAQEISRLEKGAKASEQERRARRKRGEGRAESDDAVRSNIPPELVPLWERVRKSIRGTDRRSRTEAFQQYAEENPGEVYAAQEQEAERGLRRDIKRARAAGGARPSARAPASPAFVVAPRRRADPRRGDLTAVPF
jgi:hypothetical protein